jgi:serine/threonine protein kinase
MRITSDLSGRDLQHVIPVLDAGEDASSGSYFVVMPRAEKTLQGDINRGAFTDFAAAQVMLDISDGLSEVRDIVHRDLKPANVLYHAGRWKVADFGIARFVEESTSLNTLKDCLSPQYAAPEQWRYEHATSKTDIYGLGCIGYALLTGHPPFNAKTKEELRDQHLNGDPPQLPAQCSPRLKTLLSMMLRKPQDARPNLTRVKEVLTEFLQNSPGPAGPGGLGLLAEAGAEIARAQARVEQAQQQERSEAEVRTSLFHTGGKILGKIIERLFARVGTEAPNANQTEYTIELGGALLNLSGSKRYHLKNVLSANAFEQSKWDVIAAEEIVIEQRNPEYRWSSSLLYCRLPGIDGTVGTRFPTLLLFGGRRSPRIP